MDSENIMTPKTRFCIIGAALIALFLGAMDSLVMSVAMPTIVSDLGGLHLYAWVYSAFFLTSAISLPIMGKLADLYQTKALFNFAIGLFIISSIAAGLSKTMVFLVIARAFQGIGAGGNLALVYIVLSDVAPLGKRAKTLALASFIWGIASVLGPSVGGIITTYFSWRWIFYINVPIGLISMAGIGLLFIEMRPKKQKINLDIAGAVSLAGMVFSGLTILLMGGREYPWLSTQVVLLSVLTMIFAASFYAAEKRARDPILNLAFFKIRGFAFGNGAVFMASFAIFSLFAYTPLFIQGALRKSPLEVGTIMLAISLGWSCGPLLLSQILHRVGNKAASGFGAILIGAGNVYALTFNTATSMVECFIAFAVVGFGMGFISLCTLLEVQASLSPNDLGVATSSHQFSRTLGGAIGVGVCGGLVTGRLMSQLEKAGQVIPADLMSQVSENIESIFRPEFFTPLSNEIKDVLQNAVVNSIATVFQVVLVVAIVALIFSGLLPKRGGKV